MSMPEDIESTLSRTFQERADAVTPGGLRYKGLRGLHRGRDPRPSSRVLMAALSATCVVAIAGGVAVASRTMRSGVTPTYDQTAGASGPTATPVYVGGHWALTSVEHQGTKRSVPTSLDAWIEFGRTGQILMSDSVDALSGQYTTAGTGFVTSRMGTTYVAYGGTDPTRRTVIAAIDAIAFGPMTSGTSPPTMATHADVVAGRLVLDVAGYQLTLTRTGDAVGIVRPAA